MERWQMLNHALRPVDTVLAKGIDFLVQRDIYEPVKEKFVMFTKKTLKSNFVNGYWLHVEGEENIPKEGGALIACNHQSWLDAQVLGSAVERRLYFVAKSEFLDWPVLRLFFNLMDTLYIRRGGDREGLQSLANHLRGGKAIVFFPEGTIPGEEDVPRWAVEKETGLLKGHTGIVRLAIMAGVPIIPAGVSGTGKAFPPEAYPRLQQLPLPKKVPLTLRFGKPISFEGVSIDNAAKETLREMTDKVMAEISRLVDHEKGFISMTVPVPEYTPKAKLPPIPLRNEPLGSKVPLGALVLHGFTSDLSTVSGLEPYLKAQKLPYRIPILRGHGTRFQDMVGVTAKDWYEDAEAALFDLLAECDRAVIVGLSMGGLVALNLAARHADKVAGLVTVAAALRFADPLSFLSPVLAKFVQFWPAPNSYNDPECGKQNRNYRKFSTDAFVSLYRYAAEVANVLSFVHAPALIIQSKKDTIVTPKSAEVICEKISSKDKRIAWFERSGHEMMLDIERSAVFAEIDEFARKISAEK